MLVAVDDTQLFEKCGANNFFSHYGEELATGATHALSQLVKRLSKVLGLNMLCAMNENTSEPWSLLPEVTFLEILNKMLSYSQKEEDAKVEEEPTVR